MKILIILIIFVAQSSAFFNYLSHFKFIGSSYKDFKSLYVVGKFKKINNTTYFDPEKPSVLIIHGWMNNYRFKMAKTLVDAFLTRPEYNLIFADWGSTAIDLDYRDAVEAVPGVAKVFLLLLNKMSESYDLTKIHVIGHSLGAQVAARLGEKLKAMNITLSRITGLDPAGPLFTKEDPIDSKTMKFFKNRVSLHILKTLSKGNAEFVDIIHSNAGLSGSKIQSGDLDFWPNGGSFQPSCAACNKTKNSTMNSFKCRKCSHSAAYKLFAESVKSKDPIFVAFKCPENSTEFSEQNCQGPESTIMGFQASKNSTSGNYFLKTLEEVGHDVDDEE
ncbi:unnamed protein product [Chironomus riparius]|uniref:Lipase domain-containing protein n=1 Tax=Chironomus riparius TaxID=315576 RepID=A0A9N9WY81_9DIPT|nr:unnamed protein product [Chironomus riparius]